ncbi:MAG: glycosyltransferase [Geminicoccaceae bacterium]
MIGKPAHVAICACTMDRPQGLGALLDGLARQRFDQVERPRLTLVIADNSKDGSARAMVEDAGQRLGFPTIYAHQPERGYSNARNALLDAAPADATWLAFIDDDEIPGPAWLDSLLATAKRSSAPLIAGPVRPIFPPDAPPWARQGGFFELGPFEEGASAPYVSTNNALVLASLIRERGWRFHPAFNRHGGEDEHFFRRAMRGGLVAVTSADAVVEETIPLERISRRWLFERHRRMGRTIARIDAMNGHSPARAVKALGWLAAGTGTCAAGLLGDSVRSIRGLCLVAWSLGSIEELASSRTDD